MNRKEAKQLLPIIKAYAEGKEIEGLYKGTVSPWFKIKDMDFNGGIIFRIKPEPKYRPFKNAEECWQEMQNHQPFGWIKCKDNSTLGKFMHITSVRNNEISISSGVDTSYSELIKYYVFIDGTPLGVKEI